MKNWHFILLIMVIAGISLQACTDDEGGNESDDSENDFTALLTNQIDGVILPAMEAYQDEMTDFESAVQGVSLPLDNGALTSLRNAFSEAYTAYQVAAVHDYFSTSSIGLTERTNLYPIDLTVLETLVDSESNNFGSDDHERADGFPAIDFMLYGSDDVLAYFNEDEKRLAFLNALVSNMKTISDDLVSQWTSLREPFSESAGTGLGSAISGQLNGSLAYYEFTIREDKVGIPIGLVGPNDSPITPDATKIEAFYRSQADGNDNFALSLVRTAVEEMEKIYLGTNSSGVNGQGYDDLLTARDQESIDADIKAQFQSIYTEIDSRSSITEDNNRELYDLIQGLVTLYKSDLFPILNIQDADGANDGD
ncbi:MAG: imelysin family protein [Bacteroidota bacterium]